MDEVVAKDEVKRLLDVVAFAVQPASQRLPPLALNHIDPHRLLHHVLDPLPPHRLVHRSAPKVVALARLPLDAGVRLSIQRDVRPVARGELECAGARARQGGEEGREGREDRGGEALGEAWGSD